MDIFEVHRRIMGDYASYIRSFVSISDDEMRKRVEQHLNDGHLWPEPLLTFNPSFAKVGKIEELVASGILAAPLGDAPTCVEDKYHQTFTFRIEVRMTGDMRIPIGGRLLWCFTVLHGVGCGTFP